MSTYPHTPMAYQFVEDTGVKHLPMQRSERRQALGALLGGLFLFSLGVPHPAQAQGEVTFTTASLQGTYAYVNNVGDVGSLGLIIFDGNGGTTAQIKVNQSGTATGSRTIAALSGPGTYTVDPTGTGVVTIQFEGVTGPSVYDFVITKVAKQSRNTQALAEDVFAVSRAGGLSGQLVAPMWKRISD
jgi:hypothetical protein